MTLPMLLTTRYISNKEAAKAAKNSSVKIAGRDVLATWKLMVAIILVPVLHLTYTSIAFLLYGEVGAVAWFFFAPFAAATGVFCTEFGVKLFYSIMPLIKVNNTDFLSKPTPL
jgi:glycerol-3-phosphate O-acyltransferase/dihydroxyacetone phosphate acyltransferase